MFETGVVRANECRLIIVPGHNHDRYMFLIFYYMNVSCVFLLESPQRGDSNEDTQHTIFNIKQKSPLIILWDFSKGLKNEFERDIVNEPSVFELLKFCCRMQT